jgi:hypothetical protein
MRKQTWVSECMSSSVGFGRGPRGGTLSGQGPELSWACDSPFQRTGNVAKMMNEKTAYKFWVGKAGRRAQ